MKKMFLAAAMGLIVPAVTLAQGFSHHEGSVKWTSNGAYEIQAGDFHDED